MKRALPAALLLSAAGLTYLLWPADAPRSADAKKPEARASKPSPVAAPKEPWTDGSDEAREGCVFEDGARLSYQLQFRARSEIKAQLLGQPGDEPIATTSRQTMRLHALVVEPTSATHGGEGRAKSGQEKRAAVLLVRFEEVTSEGIGRIPESLESPFLLRVNDRCELDGFARHAQLDRRDARTQQAFAYELNPSWRSEERSEREVDNSTGRAVVEVSARVRSGQRTIQQSVRRYQELWRSQNGAVLDFGREPVSSELTAVMGDGPWFERFHKDEMLNGVAGSTSMFVQARRESLPEQALDRALYTPKSFVWENLLPEHIATPDADAISETERRAQDKVRHFTPELAAQRFMQRFESGAGIQQVWPELSYYLEARPEETDTLVSMMKRDEISTAASPAFYMALGRARTPQARDALLSIMRDEVAPTVERVRAMFGLVDRADVGAALANELSTMSLNISRGQSEAERMLGREALLAVGALAGMHEDDAEVKGIATQAAALAIADGDDAKEKRPGYGAIANIGDPANLRFAEEASHSRDPREREAAAIVIRRMHPRDTSDFVAAWLARESNVHVKEALYTTVDLQTIDTQVAVGRRLVDQALIDLANEPRVITRKAILNVLGRSSHEFPQAKQALIAQIPKALEDDTGIYDTIVRHLAPDEIRAAIAHVGKEIQRGR